MEEYKETWSLFLNDGNVAVNLKTNSTIFALCKSYLKKLACVNKNSRAGNTTYLIA